MTFDFPTLLVGATLFTGAAWALDALLLAPRRRYGSGDHESRRTCQAVRPARMTGASTARIHGLATEDLQLGPQRPC